jgi:hypothetical protein
MAPGWASSRIRARMRLRSGRRSRSGREVAHLGRGLQGVARQDQGARQLPVALGDLLDQAHVQGVVEEGVEVEQQVDPRWGVTLDMAQQLGRGGEVALGGELQIQAAQPLGEGPGEGRLVDAQGQPAMSSTRRGSSRDSISTSGVSERSRSPGRAGRSWWVSRRGGGRNLAGKGPRGTRRRRLAALGDSAIVPRPSTRCARACRPVRAATSALPRTFPAERPAGALPDPSIQDASPARRTRRKKAP